MRPKTILVLFVLVLGLGGFIWFYERDLPGTDERAELERRVVGVEADAVTEIEIERDGRTVRMSRPAPVERDEEVDGVAASDPARARREWRLHEPFDTRADGATVDRLVADLTALEQEREFGEVDLAAVGLEKPRAAVTLRSPEGEITVRVGAEVPASSNMVVAAGDGVFVVGAGVWSLLATEPGDWRSRDLLPSHRGAVERLELRSEGSSWALKRRGAEEFWLESPFEDLAGKSSIDELMAAFFDFKAKEFVDAPTGTLSEMGLEPAAARVEVEFVDREAPVVLELGAAVEEGADDRYARIEGRLVTVGNGLDEILARPASDWQSLDWTALEVYEVDSLRVEDDQGELLLERAGSDWKRNGVKISYSPVSDFLYALTGAAAERIVDRAQAAALGADLNTVSLRLYVQGDEAEESLALYDAGASAVAGREGRSYLLSLATGTVEDLRLKLQAIRDEPEMGQDDPAELEG